MTCPNCAHVYPISNGIPNMVCIFAFAFSFAAGSHIRCIPRFSYWRSTRLGSVLTITGVNGLMQTQLLVI